ncbi:MAG: 30S ribosomal protein S24e [Candidatus Diapherotrites archaeon]
MEVKIIKEQNNPLLKRTEIEFESEAFKATPKIQELREKIAAKTGKDSELIAIVTVKQEFGAQKAKGKAHSYETKEQLKKVELPYVLAKNFGKEKEKLKKIRENKKAEKEKKKLEKGKTKKK